MIWRVVVASTVVLGLVASSDRALANGRAPGTASIAFRQGHESDIVAGLTFGLVFSHDGGQTWAWMCEDTFGIKASGPYDARLAYTSAGTVFSTTLIGLKVMRDGCTFGDTQEGGKFVSANALGPGPDGAFYYAAAQTADTAHGVTADFQIYKSTDGGMTFPIARKPGAAGDTNVWWESLVVAPSNVQIVYLSGYRYLPGSGGAGPVRDHLLFRSDDGGMTWNQLPVTGTGLVLMKNSVIHIAGITKDDPRHLYARVELVDDAISDALFVSTDAGATWKEIRRKATAISAFVVRAAVNGKGKHDLILATQALGAEISDDDGAMTWTALANAPHIGCLVENTAGELWACTQNYSSSTTSDNAGIMKTTDLVTWTKVLRYQELTDVVTCPTGTVQHDTCAKMLWCTACEQLGCTPSTSYGCVEAPPQKSGCCDTGSGAGGPLALGLSIATLLLRPRGRRARRRAERVRPTVNSEAS